MGRGPAAGRKQGSASRRSSRRRITWRITGPIISAAVLAAASGCSVGVPDPEAPRDVQTTPALATPTITPGHDAEAVAAKDLPFTAGDSLAAGIAVGLSDGLREAPGWKTVKENVAGENRYLKTDGCAVSARVRGNQGSLAVPGDDKASTVELFKYVDSRILPGSLKTDTLRWGGEPDKPGPKAEVLVFESVGGPGGNSTAVLARLFGKAGSSIYISVSCPDTAALAAARTDVAERLIVVPPTN